MRVFQVLGWGFDPLRTRRNKSTMALYTSCLIKVIVWREPDTRKREGSIGAYFHLVHEPDAESKCLAFKKVLAELKAFEGE
jgi:hypothetical protein